MLYTEDTHKSCPCVCFTEPFPAFKSWQEDSESGEAQLSPQAARMTHHPLGEDCPPVLSHRSLDFGQSQRFLHDPEALDFSSKALSFTRSVISMYLRGSCYSVHKSFQDCSLKLLFLFLKHVSLTVAF